MERLARFAPWITRAVLAGATLIFTMIGLRYIVDPVRYSAEVGVNLGSALGSTTTRVGSGAFPLGFAIFTLFCLIARRWLLAGVGLVLSVVTTAIIVRILGLVIDGPAPHSIRLFIPEGAILVLAVTAIILEVQRRRISQDIASQHLSHRDVTHAIRRTS